MHNTYFNTITSDVGYVQKKILKIKIPFQNFFYPFRCMFQNHERVQNFCFYPFRKKLKENPDLKTSSNNNTDDLTSSFLRMINSTQEWLGNGDYLFIDVSLKFEVSGWEYYHQECTNLKGRISIDFRFVSLWFVIIIIVW